MLGKQLGFFDDEVDAACAFDEEVRVTGSSVAPNFQADSDSDSDSDGDSDSDSSGAGGGGVSGGNKRARGDESSAGPEGGDEQWTCKVCTLFNEPAATSCAVCETDRVLRQMRSANGASADSGDGVSDGADSGEGGDESGTGVKKRKGSDRAKEQAAAAAAAAVKEAVARYTCRLCGGKKMYSSVACKAPCPEGEVSEAPPLSSASSLSAAASSASSSSASSSGATSPSGALAYSDGSGAEGGEEGGDEEDDDGIDGSFDLEKDEWLNKVCGGELG